MMALFSRSAPCECPAQQHNDDDGWRSGHTLTQVNIVVILERFHLLNDVFGVHVPLPGVKVKVQAGEREREHTLLRARHSSKPATANCYLLRVRHWAASLTPEGKATLLVGR